MIKEYIERHQKIYWVGSLIVVAGITCYFSKSRIPLGELTNRAGLIIGDQTIKQTTKIVNRVNHGRPGNMVYSPELDKFFASQREVSRIFRIPEPVLSKHLNGHIPNAYGHYFDWVEKKLV